MKLYKYRSIKDRVNFDNYMHALEEGYLWFADIKSLNDPSDSTIYYDQNKEEALFNEYYSNNQAKIYRAFLKQIFKTNPQISPFVDSLEDEQLLEIVELVSNGKFNDFLTRLGSTKSDLEKFSKAKSGFDSIYKEQEDSLRKILEPMFEFNDTFRHTFKVFSVSDSAENVYLWTEYAHQFGFCIEYDTDLITDEMYDLSDFNQVIYADSREHFSWLPLLLVAMQLENENIDKLQLESELKRQLLTKELKWGQEREFRFFSKKENIVNANIVSGVVIHQSIVDTREARELIKLAKSRSWTLSIWDGSTLTVATEKDLIESAR